MARTQIRSDQLLSCVRLFVTSWTAAYQASLSITNSRNLLKLMSIKLVIPSNRLILCCSLLLLSSILPSIRVFSNESALCGPMDYGVPGFSVHHQLPELAQTHVHSNCLILCPPLLLLPSIFPSIRIFLMSRFRIRWPKYWSYQSFQ